MSLFTWPGFPIRFRAVRGPDSSAARAPARTVSLLLLFACAGLVSCAASSPAAAEEAAAIWRAGQVSGDVQARSGGDWHALKDGDVLGDAAEVRTGRDGHAVLAHMTTTITVEPDSDFALPNAQSGAYRILQKLGNVIYKVKQRVASMAKFEVETPYLTAVVKGTEFSVDSGPQGGAVEVIEGVVGVQSMSTGESATLTVGQTARMASAGGSKLTIEGSKAGDAPKAGPDDGKASDVKENKADDRSASDDGASAGSEANDESHGRGPVVLGLPEPSDARAQVIHNDGSDEGPAVTVTKLDGAPGTAQSRHPNAVAIFVAGSGDGIFAPGTDAQTAFKNKSGDDSSGGNGPSATSDNAGIGKVVSALATEHSNSGGKSDDDGLGDIGSKSGSNSGSSGGSSLAALSTGGSLGGNSGSGSLSSNSGGVGGGNGSGGVGGGNSGSEGSGTASLAIAGSGGTLGAIASGTLGIATGTLGSTSDVSSDISKGKGKGKND